VPRLAARPAGLCLPLGLAARHSMPVEPFGARVEADQAVGSPQPTPRRLAGPVEDIRTRRLEELEVVAPEGPPTEELGQPEPQAPAPAAVLVVAAEEPRILAPEERAAMVARAEAVQAAALGGLPPVARAGRAEMVALG
jgi:hypothetical protein